ncbi:MAG: InlB B-repeat-containing protein, partial [Acholeplasmataceae bacterium]|nr:InlB B-repeat-containing protein [Acholeplasmataceae bacterium]
MKKISTHLMRVWLVLLVTLFLVSCKPGEPTPEPTPEPTVYQVTFDADNGTTDVVVQVEEGMTVAEPDDPVKDGYTFNAWYLGEAAYDFTTPVNGNITLIAHYTEIIETVEYTVSFNTVGGTPIDDAVVISGEKVSEPTAPVKTGFSFENWLLDGETYDFDDAVTSDLELYAVYAFVGIPDSPVYEGRVYNEDFDQLINDFSEDELASEIVDDAFIDEDQPYIRVGYSGIIGNNPDGALWKQAGSENSAAPAFQYL